jgi:hypothetical protein
LRREAIVALQPPTREMCSTYSETARVGKCPMPLLQGAAVREHGARFMRLRARVGRSLNGESRVEVHNDEMTFFTHRVNGRTYGAWYRHLAPLELEIIGAGFMRKATYAGSDELSVARSVLEDFLRGQLQAGAQPQSLDQCDRSGR